MVANLLGWLDHRTGYKFLVHEALNEPIPGGARWRYITGSMLTFAFAVQVITGFFLWTAYSPSTQTAWESVYYIQHVMTLGWLVRGIHHFAAQAMMVLLGLHFLQVVWDGAYRAPREVNFWLGLVLMLIVIALSLTGYLLPWDQKGYYATKVATNIAGASPEIGPQIQQIAQGGSAYGHLTLTRFFALHAGLLPALLVAFLGLHVYVFRRHGITVPPAAEGKPADTFWPKQVLFDAVGCLVTLAIVLYFAYSREAELTAPADPGEDFPARPEWYFLFLFRFIEFEAISQYGVAFGAIYIPTVLMILVFLMPFIGRTRIGHQFNRLFMVVMLVGMAGLTVMTIVEDNHNESHQAKLRFAERDAHRVVALAKREGIPPNGARALLVSDPFSQGPRLFRRHCSSCHRFDGHDGTGQKILKTVEADGKKTQVPEPETAADLKDFGTREWITRVLTDYDKTFQPLENAGEAGKKLLTGDMSAWCKENQKVLADAANAESLNSLVEFLAAQSGRTDTRPFDETLVAAGKEIFKSGMLKSGSFNSSCADCHAMQVGDAESLSDGGGAPTLTGYASRKWLKAFLRDPGHADFYGEKNTMMVFDEKRLSETDLNLLVNWMVGDYYRPGKAEH
ncbi:MAG: cytochrome b N-terminal domain-containing protein [Planctomycetes bacterium]|nr:cytochrome b N-terminal domain-containing protein [Planctomycetota bacterium]